VLLSLRLQVLYESFEKIVEARPFHIHPNPIGQVPEGDIPNKGAVVILEASLRDCKSVTGYRTAKDAVNRA